MEEKKEIPVLLDLMAAPGFSVRNGILQAVNAGAKALFFAPGMAVAELLRTGRQEYAALEAGCLYLTLELNGVSYSASVSVLGEDRIFLLEQTDTDDSLRALALAAKELRKPLTTAMLQTDALLGRQEPEVRRQAAQLNQGLYQLLRIIGNMSDAGQYGIGFRPESMELDAFLRELAEKAAVMAAASGLQLTYQGPEEPVFTQADPVLLERAVLNLISNAIKFTPAGGTVELRLIRHGHQLQLQVTDSGSGIAENIRAGLFTRHLRQPAIEDSRFGIGLGMVLVRKAAACHGGTVLIDQPQGKSTRVTLTLSRRMGDGRVLSSPVRIPRAIQSFDPFLVELADCLPPELYET